MLLPWNGGAKEPAALPVLVAVQRENRTGPSNRLRLGWILPSTSGLVVKTCLASCGLATTMIGP